MTSPPTAPSSSGTSTRPYLIRALHDWCSDNGFTPYIAVYVDARVQVPNEYVKNNEIVLNVGFEATTALKLGNETIEFKARFGGKSREIMVPVDHVIAIYARENGQGMAFPSPANAGADAPGAPPQEAAESPQARGPRLAVAEPTQDPSSADADSDAPEPPPADPPSGKRAALKRIK